MKNIDYKDIGRRQEEGHCRSCRWWEYDHIAHTRFKGDIRIGTCQVRDKEESERSRCSRWIAD